MIDVSVCAEMVNSMRIVESVALSSSILIMNRSVKSFHHEKSGMIQNKLFVRIIEEYLPLYQFDANNHSPAYRFDREPTSLLKIIGIKMSQVN